MMMPSATWTRRFPCASITPQPVRRSPGSSPKRRIIGPLASGAQARHDVVGNLIIGEERLHVVAVLQCLEQLEQGLGGLAFDRRHGFGPPGELCRKRGPELFFQ